MLEAAITTPQVPVNVRVGTGAKAFVDRTVTRAVYATGWEGTVVVEVGARNPGAKVARRPIAVRAMRESRRRLSRYARQPVSIG